MDKAVENEVVKSESEEIVVSKRGRRGQTMTEYAIIVALIALACVGAMKVLGENIGGEDGVIEKVNSAISDTDTE